MQNDHHEQDEEEETEQNPITSYKSLGFKSFCLIFQNQISISLIQINSHSGNR